MKINPESIWQTSKSLVLFIILGVVIFTGNSIAKSWKGHYDLKNKLFQEQMVQISKNMVSQRAEINTKLLEEKLKSINKAITELIQSRGQEVNDVGSTVATLDQSFNERDSLYFHDSDSSKDYDEVLIVNEEVKSKDGIPLPVGWAMYSPNIEGDEKWTVGTYPLKFHESIVIAEDGERTDVYVEAWIENDIFKNTKGKKFPITVENVEWTKRYPSNSWSYNIRPSINMGFSTRVYSSLSFSFFSYGKSKRDMDWRILGLGFGKYQDDLTMQLLTAEYNLGNKIPYIENLFVGPHYIFGKETSTFGLNFGVPF